MGLTINGVAFRQRPETRPRSFKISDETYALAGEIVTALKEITDGKIVLSDALDISFKATLAELQKELAKKKNKKVTQAV